MVGGAGGVLSGGMEARHEEHKWRCRRAAHAEVFDL